MQRKLREAEGALVLRNFQRSRSLAVEAIKKSQLHNSKEEELQLIGRDEIHLKYLFTTSPISFIDDNINSNNINNNNHGMIFEFQIDHARTITVVDRAAVVLLQSSYELFKLQANQPHATTAANWPFHRRNNNLRDDLDMVLHLYAVSYRQPFASMPLEVAVVFIGYCHAIGYVNTSMALILDLIVKVCPVDTTTKEGYDSANIARNVDDLLWILMTKILPYASNPNEASVILNSLLRLESNPPKLPLVLEFSSDPNEHSVARVMDALDNWPDHMMHSPSTRIVIKQCREFLLPWMPSNNRGQQYFNSDGNHSIVPMRFDNNSSGRERKLSSSIMIQFRQTVFHVYHLVIVLRQYMVAHYWKSNDRWANRSKAAISMFILFVLWKKQRMIRRKMISLVAAVCLGPIREILDAFMVTSPANSTIIKPP